MAESVSVDRQKLDNIVDAVNEKTGNTSQMNLDSIPNAVRNIKTSDSSLGITAASVGQIAKIKAIDENGKPTEWEPVNIPKEYNPPPGFNLIYEDEVLKPVAQINKIFDDTYVAMIIGIKCPNPGSKKNDLFITAGSEGTVKGVGVPYNKGIGYDSRMQIKEDHGVWDVMGMHGFDSYGITNVVGPVGCATPVIIGHGSFQIPYLKRAFVYVLGENNTIDIHTKIKVWGRK